MSSSWIICTQSPDESQQTELEHGWQRKYLCKRWLTATCPCLLSFFCDFCVKSEFFKTSSSLNFLTCLLGTRKCLFPSILLFTLALLQARAEWKGEKPKPEQQQKNPPNTTFIPESNLQWESLSLFLSNSIWTKFKNLIFPIALLCTLVDSESLGWNQCWTTKFN